MTMMAMFRVAALLMMFAVTAPTVAESQNLAAGKWKFDSTTVMSMMPQPQTTSETKCITEEVAKQDPLAEIVEKGNCKILSREQSGDTLDFEIECSGDAKMPMKSRGKGSFTADGKVASGKMNLEIEMPQMADMPQMQAMGGKMTMTQEWKGERLGACD